MTTDCLPVTGSASLPLLITAVALICAGVAALFIRRTAHRAPRAIAVMLALGLCTGGTMVMSVSGDAPAAQAMAVDDGCSEQVATTGPGALPSAAPDPTADPDPDPTTDPDPTADPDPDPDPDPTADPDPDPTADPDPDPEPDPTADPHPEPDPSDEPASVPPDLAVELPAQDN